MTYSLSQKLAAEALGTLLLAAVVIGSGIMGERLAGGNDALALLGATLATGAGLIVLILIFAPVSGAHFNPAATLGFALRREIAPSLALAYAAAQIGGGLAGAILAHAMFDLDLIQQSAKARDGAGALLGEAVATGGLVLTIFGTLRFRPETTPFAVGLFIAAGYWFTSSTAFANPAVTLARAISDTFAGIAPASAPAFVLVQFAAAGLATLFAGWLFAPRSPSYRAADAGASPEIPRAR